MLEEHQELDPQIRKLMTDNQIWYDTYRDSESMNQSSDRDDQRMPIHKKTVSTYDSHDEQLGAVHALADFVEQYRVTKDHRLTKIQNRATSQESPSDEYKKKYKEVSAIAFDTATSYSRRDDVSLYLGDLSREELEEAKKKFPLFPKGSRFKANEEQRKEDERLFGKENK